MALLDRRAESFAWERLRRRSRARSVPLNDAEPPERPLGVKLELTYACNLRCGFCYTDSPRRTLQRAVDLSDDDWRRIVDEAIDLGVLEAVVTGGEPLLRRELCLDLVERLARAGVGVTLNTNGWFVDSEVARHLGTLRGVTAHVSIDGAGPHLHDPSRGLPGSWRRAVQAIDHLLSAGVGVCVVHVVTPPALGSIDAMLEQMWLLGVPWMRVTPVLETGAAARGGSWKVPRAELRRAEREFRARRGTDMRVDLRGGSGAALAHQGERPPASMLVRPNGGVRPDSLRPFTFGDAARDGLGSCWEAMRSGWRDERITSWARALRSSRDLPEADLVAYLDEEIPIAGTAPRSMAVSGRDAPVPEPVARQAGDPEAEVAAAEERIRGLASSRRYRHAGVRGVGGPAGLVLRRIADGQFLRLNRSGAVALEELDGGTPADVARRLAEVFGGHPADYEVDAIAATRRLQAKGLIIPAAAGEGSPSEPGASDLPGSEPVAEPG